LSHPSDRLLACCENDVQLFLFLFISASHKRTIRSDQKQMHPTFRGHWQVNRTAPESECHVRCMCSGMGGVGCTRTRKMCA
jgi:hypothetical protein